MRARKGVQLRVGNLVESFRNIPELGFELKMPMKIPENVRPAVIVGAWLATAALTFGLGRLTAFVDAPPVASVEAPVVKRGAIAVNSVEVVGGERFGDFTLEGGAGKTIEDLTGGKPMGEWLKRLLAQDDEVVRMTGFMMLLEKLNTPEEIEAALVVVHGRSDWGGRSREAAMLLQKWTKLDPKSSMAYVQGLKDPGSKYGGMNTVLQTWTRANPQEAVAWAKANGENKSKDSQDGNWAMSSVINQLAKSNIGEALQLAEGEGVSRARGYVIDTLVSQLVTQRGETAAREAALGITDESMKAAMVRQLAGRAANSNPGEAMAWVGTLPAGEAKNSALAETVSQWAQKDVAGATAYMKGLAAGVETDGTRARFAQAVVRSNPLEAVAWANTITDPKARTASLGEVVGSWMRSDADAAKQWVAASPLPAETKTEIMSGAGRSRGGWQGGPGSTRGRVP